jgi:hypothetical protein
MTVSYWGRIAAYNQSGSIHSYGSAYTDKGGTPTFGDIKSDIAFLSDKNYNYRFQPLFSNQSNYVQDVITDLHEDHSSFTHSLIVADDGKLACLISDSGRVHFIEYDDVTPAVTEMYYDLDVTTLVTIQIDNYMRYV